MYQQFIAYLSLLFLSPHILMLILMDLAKHLTLFLVLKNRFTIDFIQMNVLTQIDIQNHAMLISG